MTFKVYIPARFGASRLPGKPLLDIHGEPLIRHVYRAASRSRATEVVIATDDMRIGQCAGAFGAKVCMTGPHDSGTDRLGEAVTLRRESDETIVVNVQGDEPLLPPVLIDQVAALLDQNRDCGMATLCTPITTADDLFNPNVVKVVCDRHDKALYFSRAAVPWDRDHFFEAPVSPDRATLPDNRWLRHIGIYAYRASFLKLVCKLEPAPCEKLEKLEQLRVLWHGHKIAVAVAASVPEAGVDTQADLDRVRQKLTPAAETSPTYADKSIPPQPERPDPYECCGRGCERCVYVYYEEAMEKWRAALVSLGIDPGQYLDPV